MVEQTQIALLGGDERQIYAARELARSGRRVTVWGLGNCAARVFPAETADTWESAVADARAVILPLPASTDGVRVNSPFTGEGEGLRLDALTDALKEDCLLLGGKLPETVLRAGRFRAVDYFDSEVLQVRNALPTAEGAIFLAMRELPVCLSGSVAAVIGYGRIGSLLSEKLTALGTSVTVYARRAEVLAQAELRNCRAERIQEGVPLRLPTGCRVVFNTVPHWLLTDDVLRTVPADCVLIDLASAPGGIDRSAAEKYGIRTVWGTALPGKCVPETAGAILAGTIGELLTEEGVI